MKRIMTVLALAAFAATPAAAQWLGMPVWNSPKGGTGLAISGDYASSKTDAGGGSALLAFLAAAGDGSALGARASVGIGPLSLTAGLASYDSDVATDKITSFGATAGFRVIGGSLLPIAVNLQAGVGRTGDIKLPPIDTLAVTTLTGSVGVAVSVPTPGISIEPYVSLGIRRYSASGTSESTFGWVLGANVGLGMLGLHVAYDSESLGGGATRGIFGIGAHFALKAPMGM